MYRLTEFYGEVPLWLVPYMKDFGFLVGGRFANLFVAYERYRDWDYHASRFAD